MTDTELQDLRKQAEDIHLATAGTAYTDTHDFAGKVLLLLREVEAARKHWNDYDRGLL